LTPATVALGRTYGGVFYTLYDEVPVSSTDSTAAPVASQCVTPLSTDMNNGIAATGYAQTGGTRKVMSGSALCSMDGTTT
tara:strand:- start:2099 stop:2338 length:240 start_codon:yes stop_codon:yes gene_type:complete